MRTLRGSLTDLQYLYYVRFLENFTGLKKLKRTPKKGVKERACLAATIVSGK